jgi:anti-sigma B factor antagonist
MKYQHNIYYDFVNEIPVIHIEGDLTSDADVDAKVIYNEIKEKINFSKLIIDFEKTKYINSSGIATLISIIQNVNEKNGIISFVGMSDHLQKVMEIVGISEFVNIFSSIDNALTA